MPGFQPAQLMKQLPGCRPVFSASSAPFSNEQHGAQESPAQQAVRQMQPQPQQQEQPHRLSLLGGSMQPCLSKSCSAAAAARKQPDAEQGAACSQQKSSQAAQQGAARLQHAAQDPAWPPPECTSIPDTLVEAGVQMPATHTATHAAACPHIASQSCSTGQPGQASAAAGSCPWPVRDLC